MLSLCLIEDGTQSEPPPVDGGSVAQAETVVLRLPPCSAVRARRLRGRARRPAARRRRAASRASTRPRRRCSPTRRPVRGPGRGRRQPAGRRRLRGGGGWFRGGGASFGGSGGGSNYVFGDALVNRQGVNNGPGVVIISWGTPDAAVVADGGLLHTRVGVPFSRIGTADLLVRFGGLAIRERSDQARSSPGRPSPHPRARPDAAEKAGVATGSASAATCGGGRV